MVFSEMDIKPSKRKQTQRKIPFYMNAKWESLKSDMNLTHQKIIDMDAPGGTTEELWHIFKEDLEHNISSHIPHKIAKPPSRLTSEIRRLIH
jgi:hypothetical protein